MALPAGDAASGTTRWRRAVIIPYVWLIAFFLVPFLIVFKISLSETTIAQPPYLPVLDFSAGWEGFKRFVGALSFDNYLALASDRLYLAAYLKSLEVAAFSTLMLLVLGYPFAYAMARAPRRLQAALVVLVVLPFWTSFLILVYAWIYILQRSASSRSRSAGSRPTPRSTSGSSIRIFRSWCCRSMRLWKKSKSRSTRPPPISARRPGRRSGASPFRYRGRASLPDRCSASFRSSANSSFLTCSAAPRR